jgi:tetratricopeptide (TPR) repeat protein
VRLPVELPVALSPTGKSDDLRRAIATTLRTCERDPIDALRQSRAMVRNWPEVPTAHRLLAFVLRKANRHREADAVDLTAIALSEQQPGQIAARDAAESGNWERAEILVRDHLKRDPEDASAAKLLADIAARFGAVREAEIFYRRSLTLAPGYHNSRLALATLLSRSGRESDALAVVDEALDRDPDHVGALSLKAALLGHGRRLDEADRLFRKLLSKHPCNATALASHAYLLKTVGRTEECISAYRKAISSDRTNGRAWFGLANLKTVRFTQDDIAAMRAALPDATDHDDHRVQLHFALGKALSDHHDYEAAFEQYAAGNAARRARFPYDADALSSDISKVARVFSPALVKARENAGSPARDPIFIVSLPRSGSTLVEQILASHPQIEGTEELYEIEGIAHAIGGENSITAYLDKIADFSAAGLRNLGDQYIAGTRRHRTTDRPYFTDKMPNNWKFIGLIHLILPNAKIIDVRRHPLGCGFANFAQFYNWGVNFSHDLTDIGRFYRDYVRQMAHFDHVLPGKVHRVFYEDLVENFEDEVRRLLHYLEVPFDAACLSFFENKRAVHTPSAEQVRRPINRDGMERWRHYEPWLGPLKESLGSVLDCYPAVPNRWPD